MPACLPPAWFVCRLPTRYTFFCPLARKFERAGVTPRCDQYLELWPEGFETYNIMVPNLFDIPFCDFGVGTLDPDMRSIAAYVTSRWVVSSRVFFYYKFKVQYIVPFLCRFASLGGGEEASKRFAIVSCTCILGSAWSYRGLGCCLVRV